MMNDSSLKVKTYCCCYRVIDVSLQIDYALDVAFKTLCGRSFSYNEFTIKSGEDSEECTRSGFIAFYARLMNLTISNKS